jgi:hypothetical protein
MSFLPNRLFEGPWEIQKEESKDDELVKSHIPYVVHASTKPVLSEPSTLRQAQGERWVEALSTNGISIGYTVHPEPVEG